MSRYTGEPSRPRRFVVLVSGRGDLSALPAGRDARRIDRERMGFRELVRVNRPLELETVRAAYGALMRVYDL